MNRQYSLPSQDLHPTIYALKEIIRLCSVLKLEGGGSGGSGSGSGSGVRQASVAAGKRKKALANKKNGSNKRKEGEVVPPPHFFGTGDRALVAFVDFHSMSMRPGTYSMANGGSGPGKRR